MLTSRSAKGTTDKMDLPKLKELTGEVDCEEWIDLLRLNLAARGLEEFLDSNIGRVSANYATKWKSDQATVSYIMRSSISAEVREDLLDGDWDPDDRDPKVLFDAITALFSIDKDVAQLKEEFETIDATDFRTLAGKLRIDKFAARLNYLKVRIMNLDDYATELQCVAAGNLAVKRTFSQFRGGKTWQELLQEIQGLRKRYTDVI